MPQGHIKKLIAGRGFGFIAGQPDDVFFHHTALVGSTFAQLQVGQPVEYTLEEGPQAARRGVGPRATRVLVLTASSVQ